jgi:hypothetical protein
MNEKIYYVYEWIRLDTYEPFYIGKGKGYRYKRTKRGNNQHFNNIVKSIPCIVNILHDNLLECEAIEYECWYIHEYKYVIGYDLVNLTEGGEGVSGYKPSEKLNKENRMRTHGFDIEDFKDDIINMYLNENMSDTEISKKYGVSDVCINRVLKKFNVKLRRSGAVRGKFLGIQVYNSKAILVKDINDNIINCFETIYKCGEWLSEIGLVNKGGGGRKAIRRNVNTGKCYKGLLFLEITKEQYLDTISQKDCFVNFKVNELEITSLPYSKIIEVYDVNNNLVNTYSSLIECAYWLVDIKVSHTLKSAKDGISRNIDNKFYKNKYTFKHYSKNEYFKNKI